MVATTRILIATCAGLALLVALLAARRRKRDPAPRDHAEAAQARSARALRLRRAMTTAERSRSATTAQQPPAGRGSASPRGGVFGMGGVGLSTLASIYGLSARLIPYFCRREHAVPSSSSAVFGASHWTADGADRSPSPPGTLSSVRRARPRTLSQGSVALPADTNLRRGGLTAEQMRATVRAAAAVRVLPAGGGLAPAADGEAAGGGAAAAVRKGRGARTYFGMDIGGTLAKIVHFEPSLKSAPALQRLSSFIHASETYQTGVRDVHLQLPHRGGTLHFIRFETRKMAAFLQLVRAEGLHAEAATLFATGGGAHKFAGDFERELGVRLEKLDELACCVRGVAWLLNEVAMLR